MNQNWNSKAELEKWLNNQQAVCKHSKLYYYREGERIPIAELEEVVEKSAKLVMELGSGYIGLFERAERELEKARCEIDTLERIQDMIIPDGDRVTLSHDFKGNLFQPKPLLLEAWAIAVSGTSVFVTH